MPRSLEVTSLSFNVTPENKSVIVLLVLSISMPSIVNLASVAATTCVALSAKVTTLSGLYFYTSFSEPLRCDFMRSAWFAPSNDFTINE